MGSTESARTRVELHFADGTKIDTFNSFQLHDSFTDPLGSQTFEIAPPRPLYAEYRKRLAKGELVAILVNGITQGSFLIQTVSRHISKSKGCVIRLTCNTVLVTPYQGHIDPDFAIATDTDTPIENIISKAMLPYGFEQLRTDGQAHSQAISGKTLLKKRGGKATKKPPKTAKAQAHENETAYGFVTRIITRLGVIMRVDETGVLIIHAPNYTQDPIATLGQSFSQRIQGDVDYFVDDIEIHDSNDGQFSECTIRGQRDSSSDTSTQRPTATVKALDVHPLRPTYKSTAAPFKPKVLRDKNSRDQATARSMGHFEIGTRALDAYWIAGEVHGFVSATGAIWTVDTVVRVRVEAEDLDENMWVLERTLMQDAQGGQKTRLKLLPLGALVIGDNPS